MSWVKLDDGFFRNSKARSVGTNGRELYLAGLCYCAGTLTDGFIPKRDIALIAAEAQVKVSVAATLVAAGMWQQEGEQGWSIPDYLTYNPSAEKVKREREEGRKRAATSAVRRGEASGEASGEETAKPPPKNGRRNGEASGDPSSSRPLVVDVSHSSSSVVPAAADDEDDWPMLIAKRRLASREADRGRVSSRPKWLRATAADVRSEYGESAADLPECWTQADIADHLEPAEGAGVDDLAARLTRIENGAGR